jgi:cytochrome c556
MMQRCRRLSGWNEVVVLRKILFILALGALSTAAAAQNTDVIAARQEIYKGFGAATKPIGPMLKGDAAFDLATVQKALNTYVAGAQKLPALFPDDSKKGHDTEALPVIWTNKDDLNARFSKFGADAQAALGSITDKASFETGMPKVLASCGGCHKAYRAK